MLAIVSINCETRTFYFKFPNCFFFQRFFNLSFPKFFAFSCFLKILLTAYFPTIFFCFFSKIFCFPKFPANQVLARSSFFAHFFDFTKIVALVMHFLRFKNDAKLCILFSKISAATLFLCSVYKIVKHRRDYD